MVAMLGGIGAALGAFVLELFTSANIAKSLEFNLIYLACLIVSGAILAGALSYFTVKALAKTGALDRFAVDRKSTRLNSSHVAISYAVFCLKKKNTISNLQ